MYRFRAVPDLEDLRLCGPVHIYINSDRYSISSSNNDLSHRRSSRRRRSRVPYIIHYFF